MESYENIFYEQLFFQFKNLENKKPILAFMQKATYLSDDELNTYLKNSELSSLKLNDILICGSTNEDQRKEHFKYLLEKYGNLLQDNSVENGGVVMPYMINENDFNRIPIELIEDENWDLLNSYHSIYSEDENGRPFERKLIVFRNNKTGEIKMYDPIRFGIVP